MALSLQEQFDLAMRSVATGDIDVARRVLVDPDTILPEDNASTAEKLGIKGGFLSAVTNTVTDPVVWISFLLSKRYPTLNWLRGTIPERFVGSANDWTGISKYTRPVENFFRGTTIPKMTALSMRRHSEVMKVGRKLIETMNRPNWQAEMPIVSLLLEGQNPASATPELRRVAEVMRGQMTQLWRFMGRTQKITGGVSDQGIVPAAGERFSLAEAPKFLRDYLPHIPLLGEQSVLSISGTQALAKYRRGQVGQSLRLLGQDPAAVWSVDRSDRLASNFSRFQGFLERGGANVINPRLFRRQRFGVPLNSSQGQDLFITDLNVVLQKYVNSVAKTYANNAPLTEHERILASVFNPETGRWIRPTSEPIIVQVINEGLKAAGANVIEQPIAGTDKIARRLVGAPGSPMAATALRHLTRSLTGQMDEGEIMFGNLFSSIRNRLSESARFVTGKQQAEVDRVLTSMQGNESFRNINNRITSFFYSTTLGLNPWSAFQNFLQPILTTAPSIGPGPALAGAKELAGRVSKYASSVRRNHAKFKGLSFNPLHRLNEAAESAFLEVFPEFARSGIRLDPRAFDIDPSGLTSIRGKFGKAFASYEDFAKFILTPFTTAELSNQATTFFGTKNLLRTAIRTGEFQRPTDLQGRALSGRALESFLDFEAGNVVNATQFRPGPGSRTIWQGSVPSPIRQFTSFPTRALSHFIESTTRGALTAKQLETAGFLEKITGGRNLGTLARTVLYGRIVNNGLRDVLGVDASNALGLGAPFFVAPPSQVLAPLPLPPAVSILAGAVTAASGRDINRIQPMVLPGIGAVPIPKTLFPGGVALSKAFQAINQFRPDLGGFVDDNERLMYRGNTTDLILRSLGVPIEKDRRARQNIERLQAVRMRVRDFRRQFAVAAINGDTKKMNKTRVDFGKAFPDFPPLDVSAKDIRRYRANARIPAVQRLVRTIGQAGPLLEGRLYEADPDILADPTDKRAIQSLQAVGVGGF